MSQQQFIDQLVRALGRGLTLQGLAEFQDTVDDCHRGALHEVVAERDGLDIHDRRELERSVQNRSDALEDADLLAELSAALDAACLELR